MRLAQLIEALAYEDEEDMDMAIHFYAETQDSEDYE